MSAILHALNLPDVPDMNGTSFLLLLPGKNQKKRKAVFTEFYRFYAGSDYSTTTKKILCRKMKRTNNPLQDEYKGKVSFKEKRYPC